MTRFHQKPICDFFRNTGIYQTYCEYYSYKPQRKKYSSRYEVIKKYEESK